MKVNRCVYALLLFSLVYFGGHFVLAMRAGRLG